MRRRFKVVKKKSHNRNFIQKTKRGSIVHRAVERYLRTDISNGFEDSIPENVKMIIIPTNVDCVIEHADLLLSFSRKNVWVVLFSTIIQLLRIRNYVIYQKLSKHFTTSQKVIGDTKEIPKKSGGFFIYANEYHKDLFVKFESSKTPNNNNNIQQQQQQTENEERNEEIIFKSCLYYILKEIPSSISNIVLLTSFQQNVSISSLDSSSSYEAFLSSFQKMFPLLSKTKIEELFRDQKVKKVKFSTSFKRKFIQKQEKENEGEHNIQKKDESQKLFCFSVIEIIETFFISQEKEPSSSFDSSILEQLKQKRIQIQNQIQQQQQQQQQEKEKESSNDNEIQKPPLSSIQQQQQQITKKGVFYEEHYSDFKVHKLLTQQQQQQQQMNHLDTLLFRGKLNVNSYDYNKGQIELSKKQQKQLMSITSSPSHLIQIIGRTNMNRAIHGDIVVVRLLSSQEIENDSFLKNEQMKLMNQQRGRKMTQKRWGRVVRIEKRTKFMFCGSIEEQTKTNQRNHIKFVSVYKRYPPILISFSTSEFSSSLKYKRIRVRLNNHWPVDSKFPHGQYCSTIGSIGDIETETKVLLEEHEIPYEPFTEKVLKCLPPKSFQITEEMIRSSHRLDLRNELIFSIDPPGCTDIDDALHCKKISPPPSLSSSNHDNDHFEYFEIGVHIADVSYFVKEMSDIDQEAFRRSTSVYLVQKRINMLPKLLTEKICSIRENEEKLCFSVIWTLKINFEAEFIQIVKTNFTRTVVHSKRAFSYAEAQELINNRSLDNEITKSLRSLNAISQILKAKRFAKGALSLMSPEVKFEFHDEGKENFFKNPSQHELTPKRVKMYSKQDTNSLVEEFMLLANISVGKKILEHFPDIAVLRKHENPVPEKFEGLLGLLEKRFGVVLNLENSIDLNKKLNSIELKSNPYFNSILKILMTRRMQQAVYLPAGTNMNQKVDMEGDGEETDFRHYGLSTEIYTHFTSPIRRYADVLVHRLLWYAIEEDRMKEEMKKNDINHQAKITLFGGKEEELMKKSEMFTYENLKSICSHMNQKTRMAQIASRASIQLFSFVYFSNRKEVVEGVIVKLVSKGVIFYIPKYGFEGYVSFAELFLCHSSSSSEKASDSKEFIESLMKIDEEKGCVTYQDKTFFVFDRLQVLIYVKKERNYRMKMTIEVLEENFDVQRRKEGMNDEDDVIIFRKEDEKKKIGRDDLRDEIMERERERERFGSEKERKEREDILKSLDEEMERRLEEKQKKSLEKMEEEEEFEEKMEQKYVEYEEIEGEEKEKEEKEKKQTRGRITGRKRKRTHKKKGEMMEKMPEPARKKRKTRGPRKQ